MKKLKLAILTVALLGLNAKAQELNCTVQIVSQQIQGTDKRVFETLRTSIFEFMNNTRWTRDIYKNDERIECTILINLTDRLSTDEFKGTIQIQSRRPVFKSSYYSTLLNYNDNDFQFRYLESQSLEFNESTNLSNLTSVLAFYAYVIIGLDYDTFSLNGGTPYYQKAMTVVNNAQGAAEKGWKAFESTKNRYWVVANLLDPVFAPIRECNYKMHRLGLDAMTDNKDGGRGVILESLNLVKKVYQDRPTSFPLQMFFNAKADEMVNIFSGAPPDEKAKASNLLSEIDPSNSTKYQRIMMTQ